MKKITPKIRFTILQRDGFCCKYCGGKSPNVQLEVDHIIPISKGGDNSLENLITSCFYCNRGKGKDIKGDSEKDLYKKKLLDLQNNVKSYFYTKWNNAFLGTIDEKTKVILAMYIKKMVMGDDGLYYTEWIELYEFLQLKDDSLLRGWSNSIDFSKCKDKFILGGDYCDDILKVGFKDCITYIDLIFEYITDESNRSGGTYSQRLNYYLTDIYEGEFYVIQKYTLFPNLYKTNNT